MKKNYFINVFYALFSYFYFRLFRKSLNKTNQALVNIYSKDNGIFMSKFHRLISYNRVKENNGDITKKKGSIYYNLKKNGYHILNQKIDTNKVNKLIKLAYNLKCDDGFTKRKFNQNNLTSNRYIFDQNDLINDKTVQSLVMDKFFIKIARDYFNSEPIFDMAVMWWSTPFEKEASSEAAQLYHYDCNGRVKWLKIFVYLTDVDEKNGPHHYIQGTHKIGSKSKKLLSRGYIRISDDEIKKYYPKDDFKVIKGAKGTTFAADTLCWHKGKNLVKGNRLVFELNYTSSLFGFNNNLVVKKENNEFLKFCINNPIYSKNFQFE
tara:strand:- start:22 stop:984 length:963 start_codon:yes stop_codon:yes gene_type:complete